MMVVTGREAGTAPIAREKEKEKCDRMGSPDSVLRTIATVLNLRAPGLDPPGRLAHMMPPPNILSSCLLRAYQRALIVSVTRRSSVAREAFGAAGARTGRALKEKHMTLSTPPYATNETCQTYPRMLPSVRVLKQLQW